MSREERLAYPPADYQLPAAAALLPSSEPSIQHSYYHPQNYPPPPIAHLPYCDVPVRESVPLRQSITNREVTSLKDSLLLREPPPLPSQPLLSQSLPSSTTHREHVPLRESPFLRPSVIPPKPPLPQPTTPTTSLHRISTSNTQSVSISYNQFVGNLLNHPLLAFLMKRIVEACGGIVEESEHNPTFEDAENKVRLIEDYARLNGFERAALHWSSLDIFMCGLITSLGNIENGGGNSETRGLIYSIRWSGSTRRIQKSRRTPLTERARMQLTRWFEENVENPYPNDEQKLELAKQCGMSLSSVKNWFGNKRMRVKRKMLTLVGGGGKMLAPKSKWNAVVVSRMNSKEGRQVVVSATRGGGGEDRYEGYGA